MGKTINDLVIQINYNHYTMAECENIDVILITRDLIIIGSILLMELISRSQKSSPFILEDSMSYYRF